MAKPLPDEFILLAEPPVRVTHLSILADATVKVELRDADEKIYFASILDNSSLKEAFEARKLPVPREIYDSRKYAKLLRSINDAYHKDLDISVFVINTVIVAAEL